jgi:hypothetical protein
MTSEDKFAYLKNLFESLGTHVSLKETANVRQTIFAIFLSFF